MKTRTNQSFALRFINCLAGISLAASAAACSAEPDAQIVEENIESTSLALQSFDSALSCVESYALSNTCDWNHWTQMYLACKTYEVPAMNNDDYLLDVVKAGECTSAKWGAYSSILEYRNAQPTTLADAKDCVSQYVALNSCDWTHWTEMYFTCRTNDFSAMAADDFLLDIVQAGECTQASWPQISALLDYRAAPPQMLAAQVSNVRESTVTTTFSSAFSSTPVVFAAMQTMNGTDPADTRIGPVTSSNFKVFVQEDQSWDSEVTHSNEVVGYLALQSGTIIDENGYTIGEVGSVSVTQDDAGKWFTSSTFQGHYVAPTVMMMSNSVNGSQAAHIRLKNVTNSSFSYQLEEWDYLDGTHSTETAVYMIVESGSHRLPNGYLLQAKNLPIGVAQSILLPTSHSATPVVFSQTQTINGGASVVTRQQNVSLSGFSIQLQEQESSTSQHPTESVGIISYGL